MKEINVTNEMINEEVSKILGGSLNESDLLKLVYLSHKMSGVSQNSTIAKQQKEIYLSNAMDSLIWPLLQRKVVALDERINEIKKLEKTDNARYLAEKGDIDILKKERDLAKGMYVKILNNLSQMNSLFDGGKDVSLNINEVLAALSNLNEEQQKLFWTTYFEEKRNFIYDGNLLDVSKAEELFDQIFYGK